jgi:hypothetical protein
LPPPRAANLLRGGDHYRAATFARGLERHGFIVEQRWQRVPRPDDILLVWNRNRSVEPVCQTYEGHGARVLIAENGFTAPVSGGKHYCLFDGHHNGRGRWFLVDHQRHPILDQPWRERGDHVLVLPQRGIGEQGIAMPSTWSKGVLERLARITNRPIVFRPHPGHRKTGEPDSLPRDLANAHCAVTWASGAAIKALQTGIPVFHEMESWIGSAAAALLDRSVEDCHMPDRGELWRRISWCQWLLSEIESGEAFDGLLNTPRGGLFCAGQQSLGDHRAGDGGGCAPAGPQLGTPLVA